jgi:hypothetical protein
MQTLADKAKFVLCKSPHLAAQLLRCNLYLPKCAQLDYVLNDMSIISLLGKEYEKRLRRK